MLIFDIEGDARQALLEEKDLQRLTRPRGQGAAGGEENFESLPGERFYKDAAAATRFAKAFSEGRFFFSGIPLAGLIVRER